MVLMGPLIKPDPETASPFQQFMARVTSQVLPSLEIGDVDINLVTSDQVRYFILTSLLNDHQSEG